MMMGSSTAVMAMTVSISIRVKPRFRVRLISVATPLQERFAGAASPVLAPIVEGVHIRYRIGPQYEGRRIPKHPNRDRSALDASHRISVLHRIERCRVGVHVAQVDRR